LSRAELERLHGPIGLRIGSKTPPEIAVAIVAEMTAVRHGVALETVGLKAGKEPAPEGNQQICVTERS
jgi:xanthine dehydrogenase accessory factor